MRKIDDVILWLSLVRIGQMLGSDTRLAKAVHDAIEVVLLATR
jgi:hypothetical protein